MGVRVGLKACRRKQNHEAAGCTPPGTTRGIVLLRG